MAIEVLVVDDEPDMRLLVSRVITTQWPDAQVVEAASGEEAIELFRVGHPAVVVLDQRMPGLQGIDVAEVIKAERAEQPVVLFSAYMTEELRQRAASIGVERCVEKGQLAVLREVLRDLVPAA